MLMARFLIKNFTYPTLSCLHLTYLIFGLIIGVLTRGQAQNTEDNSGGKHKILVINLDTSRFFSNVFYIDELAFYNEIDSAKVIEYYAFMVELGITNYQNDEVEYIFANEDDTKKVHDQSENVIMVDEKGQEFFAISGKPDSDPELLKNLMDQYNCTYVLTINFYDIYRENPPTEVYYYTRHDQILHYDLFDSTLQSVKAGKYSKASTAVEGFMLKWYYNGFAEEIRWWVLANEFKDEGATIEEKRKNVEVAMLREKIEVTGKWGIGLAFGISAPYGTFGLELTHQKDEYLDYNFGIGHDVFGGFKIGTGARYYPFGFHQSVKPFLGLSYSYANGRIVTLGGQQDDFGNQLNPDDVSKHQIFSAHIVHLRGGASFILPNNGNRLTVALGYGVPLGSRRPEVVSGTPEQSRIRFVDFMAPGGLEISLTYFIYF